MRKLRNVILAAALAALSPSPVFACAACAGGPTTGPLTHGMNAGIFTLLGIVVLMLGSIATFFVVLIRREAAAQAKQLAEESLSGAKI